MSSELNGSTEMAVKVIAEIGINHNGNLNEAKRLIVGAETAGCWGVKFQYRLLGSFYNTVNEIGDEIVSSDLIKCQFSVDEYIELTNFARGLGLKVGISFFRLEDAKQFEKSFGEFDFLKVPSAECLNVELIDGLLVHSKPLLISTGGHDFDVVERALRPYRERVTVLHCVANYPTKLGNQRLNAIRQLRSSGFASVGYSSHDEDFECCFMALALGIDYLERHLTSDKRADGLDHSSSSTVVEFKAICKFASIDKSILSCESSVVNQGERLNMQNLGCGLYLREDLEIGECVRRDQLNQKAPRLGLSLGQYLSSYADKPLTRNLKAGSPLKDSDFVILKDYDVEALTEFANKTQISIPVRLHDFSEFCDLFSFVNYEFHLSYSEILNGDFTSCLDQINGGHRISIHLPDYLPGNNILDPISDDREIYELSHKIINMTASFVDRIFEKTGAKVPIVGSFSRLHGDKAKTLTEIHDFTESSKTESFQILPQWLPAFAWYFGGSEKLCVFNDLQDIEFIEERNWDICLDVCHLGMAATTAGASIDEWFDRLVPHAKHIHISDFNGEDGEGCQIGDGAFTRFGDTLSLDCAKVIEVWQGHLDYGAGFKEAIQRLFNLKKGNERL